MKYLTLLAFVAMSALTSYAQTPSEINRKIVEAERNSIELYNGNRDSLVTIMDSTYRYLKSALPNVLGGLDFNYMQGNFIRSKTSADRKLRLWSIDESGGSAGQFENLAEFKTADGVKVQDISDTNGFDLDGWYDTIYTIRATSGNTYYLPVIHYNGDNRSCSTSVNAYMIDGNVLDRNVTLFRTPKALADRLRKQEVEAQSSSIEYSYDFFNSHGLSTIKFNGKSLFIPVVNDDSVTSHNLRYDFDGTEFVYKEIEK